MDLDPQKRLGRTPLFQTKLFLGSKFSPPKLPSDKILVRSDLIQRELLIRKPEKRRFVFLEAKAGQGKSTTALQYLEITGNPYAWYQVGEEDIDTVTFLSSLINALEYNPKVPPLASGVLVQSGEVKASDLSKIIDQLMAEIESFSPQSYTIVLDDLHIIYESNSVMSLLDTVLDSSPLNLSFLLLSRYPLPLKSKKVRFGSSTVYLTDEDLSFSLHESVELLSKLKRNPPSYEYVRELHKLTEGWITGIIYSSFSRNEVQKQQSQRDSRLIFTNLRSYFRNEVTETLPDNMLQQLYELSLLDEIPLSLGEEITGDRDLGENLQVLMEKNQFVRLVDGDVEIYSLHHLMRETLRQDYLSRSSQNERNTIFKHAVDYYIHKGHLEKAAIYVIKTKDNVYIDRFLKEHGLELIARNRFVTVEEILLQDVGREREKSPWYLFFKGLCLAEEDPAVSTTYLIRSAKHFLHINDQYGRLLSLSHIIYNYFLTSSGTVSEYKEYLEEVINLYTKNGDQLPELSKAYISKNIGVCLAVLEGKMDVSRKYLQLSLSCSWELDFPNMIVTSWVFIGYSYLLAGKFKFVFQVAESLYVYLLNRRVGNTSKILGHHFLTDILEVIDDYPNYIKFINKYHNASNADFVAKTHIAPSIILWEIKLQIARGKLDRANALIEKGLASGSIFETPHIASRYLEYKALVNGLLGKNQQTIQICISDSIKLRTRSSWGGFFRARHSILVGISSSIIKNYKQGEIWISEGIQIAQNLGYPIIEAMGYMLRGYSLFSRDADAEALVDLDKGLQLMRKNGFDMFWGWYPGIILYLFKKAIVNDIENEYVKKVCKKRFESNISVNGQIIPMIKIKILGDFRITIIDRIIIESNDLTPKQRTFLGLLLSSPRLQISQEKTYSLMWPKESAGHARRNLDTLLSRLRTLLRQLLDPQEVTDYLQVSKGIISLNNCIVDSREFSDLVKAGIDFAQKKDFWQAENHFHRAFELWDGCFASEVFVDDLSFEYCLELKSEFLRMAETWTTMLLETRQDAEAVTVLKYTNKIYPGHYSIAKKLYRVLLHQNDTFEAKAIISKYKKVLRRQGISGDEIKEKVSELMDN